MKILNSKIDGVFLIENFMQKDSRGSFSKTFNNNAFSELGLCSVFAESYYSVSNNGVIRGMHFQLQPMDHEKLVFVPKGQIVDVVLDLRKDSKTYGICDEFIISAENSSSVYIPKGCAHGFKSMDDGTITVYNVSTIYDAKLDFGIRWDSFGYDWGIKEPVISQRDKLLIRFEDFESSFE